MGINLFAYLYKYKSSYYNPWDLNPGRCVGGALSLCYGAEKSFPPRVLDILNNLCILSIYNHASVLRVWCFTDLQINWILNKIQHTLFETNTWRSLKSMVNQIPNLRNKLQALVLFSY